MKRHTVTLATVVLAIFVLSASFIAWRQGIHGEMTKYGLFPLFGLMAFGLMWTHYIGGSLKRYTGFANDSHLLASYRRVTGTIVLALILLHPALLYMGLFQDGYGLPPLSAYNAYAALAAQFALVLGSIGLVTFLLFELEPWLKNKRWWRLVKYANMVAMLLIFLHALLIGYDLVTGWFRFFWIILGWILVMSFIYNYRYDHQQPDKGAA